MNRIICLSLAATILLGLSACTKKEPPPSAEPPAPAAAGIDEQTITDAYVYLLGRALVIRQESTDMQEEGVDYNVIKYNPFGSADFVNPNLDVGKRPSSERSSCTNDRDFPALPCSRFVTGHHVISDGHGTLRAPT